MISVESLTKQYGPFTAVDHVSFTAATGRVTGFLGPNGAGKSTTMRVMVGLTRATSGRVTISGRDYRDLVNPGLEVGVLLDASAQHAGRTGREILTIAQQTMGLPRTRVAETLARVGLTEDEAARRVRDYSLGMRQRLGIATALIGDPEVLVLDEPANGLDPAGIRWMRDLLRGFAERRRHRAAVLAPAPRDRGHRRRPRRHRPGPHRGPGQQGRAARRGRHPRPHRRTPTASPVPCTRRRSSPAPIDGGLRVDAEPELVGETAHRAGVVLRELRAADGAGLEEMFLELTADTAREGAAA